MKSMARSRRKAMLWTLAITAVVIGYVGFRFGPDLLTAYRAGFLEKEVKHAFKGDSKKNLELIAQALIKYHESEGEFPPKDQWMDAISRYLRTNDLRAGEEEKKLHDPSLSPAEYGYAMNEAIAGKYVDDLPEKKNTILVYFSKQKDRSAVGDPATDARGGALIGVSFDGKWSGGPD